MAEQKEEEFLDDIDAAASEEAEVEMIDINEEADRLDELELIKNERDEFRDRFVRALADAENARKRADKDRREAENYGGSKLARDLLPVYDNLKRAVDAVTDEQRSAASGLIEGVELTMRELLSVFTKLAINSTQNFMRQCLRRLCPKQKRVILYKYPQKDLCFMTDF
jgi:molecular chaperone GrpE